MRSLVECELLYDALEPDGKTEAHALMVTRGGEDLWTTWRGLAEWCFDRNDEARHRSVAVAALIAEYELRSSSKAGSLVASIANLGRDLMSPRFLKSGRPNYFSKKLLDPTFWKRFFATIAGTRSS